MDAIQQLKQTILEANKAYRLGRPIMSDQEFDDLCEDYEGHVTPEEYREFRNSLHEDTGKVKHPYIMGSLDKLKAENPKVVNEFLAGEMDTGTDGGVFSITAKVDGISCRVSYDALGRFQSATTRGDGTLGIDCTDKVAHIVPPTVPCTTHAVDIRGELVVTFEDFTEWFQPRGFKNPRNTCAGIMNQKDWTVENIEHITFVPYEIMGGELTKSEQLKELTRLGFTPVWNITEFFSNADIHSNSAADRLAELADGSFDYPTDGLVVSRDDYRQELNEYRPKHQKAFKLNQASGWTEVVGVEWGDPSKDGRITPVAKLEAVEIAGSSITRVTLNNLEWMYGADIRLGSHVLVCKSGEVIPKIVQVDNEGRATTQIPIPETCSWCGGELTTRDDIDLCCPNENCPSRRYEQVLTFITNLGIQHVSRQTLENWGLDSIRKLIDFEANTSYKMQVRFERDLNDKMFGASEDTIFKALSFTNLAEKTLTKIVDFYGYRELESGGWKGPFDRFPEGVAEKTMRDFTACAERNFEYTHAIINESKWHGKMYTKEVVRDLSEIKGSVCFTGALRTMSRGEASAFATAAGYEVKSGVSKGLTYLVTNYSDETTKFKKAKALGIKIIDETTFLAML